jgi:hypothetical protein
VQKNVSFWNGGGWSMAKHEKITVTNIFYKEKVVTVIFKNAKKRVLNLRRKWRF